ncbi:hypothetical protein XENOCAPTIV_027717, partial [Xenoophorus captivus]
DLSATHLGHAPGGLVELTTQEGIEDGVQAAVEVGQRFGDRDPRLHRLLHLAVRGHNDVQHRKSVHEDAKAEVGDGEMEPVLIRCSFDRRVVAHDENDQSVADDAHREYYAVNLREEDLVEVAAECSSPRLMDV